MGKRFYITTPIYYVNDRPHIGHSYTTVAADVLARYRRLAGGEVFFLTGTDEHGIKICKAAGERDLTPGELADQVVVHFQDLWKKLGIEYDDFIRTSQPRHRDRVQALVGRLVERGEIYPGRYDGWYDEEQEEFVTENTARENEYQSPISGRPLIRHAEESYFFRLRRWVPRLIEYIESHPDFIMPVSRRNEVLSKLRLGVEDLSISRQAARLMNWGVPMPNDPRCSVYVWIDALSNYITALGYPPREGEPAPLYDACWPADLHLIGKDILWFHAVYWPCLLLALELPLPVTIFAHGWWTNRGRKMSKSLGNFISCEEVGAICDAFSADYYRYFLLRAVKFGDDGNFSGEKLLAIYNAELANGVGNLLSRTVKMIEKYRGGAVDPPPFPGSGEEGEVIEAARRLISHAGGWMDRLDCQSYLDGIVGLEAATNRYIEKTRPYQLAVGPPGRKDLSRILGTCAEAVRIILLYLQPVMPEKAALGLRMLGVDPAGEDRDRLPAEWGGYVWEKPARKGEPLFPKKKEIPVFLSGRNNTSAP
ncbi:MAG: methionine--tRNA ligase [PVC group bacterium]